MRNVICHYHIYKNSGTTFDTLLARNFGERHISFDGPYPFFTIDQEQLSRIIERQPKAIAFSSHQIQLPVPSSLNFLVLPVVFLRHPFLRIQSIYNFKRKTYDGTVTSRNAREMTFDNWINQCFADRREITHIANAQTRLLGATHRQRPLLRRTDFGMEYDLHQAIRNIRNVELLARTEYFQEDVANFSAILARYDMNFTFTKIKPQNTTTKDQHRPLPERIEAIGEMLSKENFQKLKKANAQDMRLFELASELIYQKKPQAHPIDTLPEAVR